MQFAISFLIISIISGAIVTHKDRHSAEARQDLPNGTKLNESVHVDPHNVKHVLRETQNIPGGHRESFVQTSYTSFGADKSEIKKVAGKLHPRIKALREDVRKMAENVY